MSDDHNQYQKPTCKDSLQVEAMKQDLVAWHEPGFYGNVTTHKDWALNNGWLPLYTAPPKREWVELTDEEIAEGAKQSWVDKQAFESAVWWAEAKLKEKNAYGWQSVSNPTEYLDELRGGEDT